MSMPVEMALIGGVKDRNTLIDLLTKGLGWPVEEEHAFNAQPEIAANVKGKSGVAAWTLVPVGVEGERLVLLAEFDGEYVRRDLRELLKSLRKEMRETARFHGVTGYADTVFIVASEGYNEVRFVLFEERARRVPRIRSFGWERDYVGRTVSTHNLAGLRWADREDWEAAWNVEALTENFYGDYEAVFNSVLLQVEAAEDEEHSRAWLQLLFNRLLFIAFIQRMGWLQVPGGSRDGFLFDLYKAPRGPFTSFYGVLRAVFSELDTPEENTQKNRYREVLGLIPYLNGGLFDKDDPLDRPPTTLPDQAFAAVLGEPNGLFAKYNFTVTESTPLDQEVAVDPEMLGKIFERLIIAEERHKTGTYYTPRPIVEFMVNEALKGYLIDRGLPPEKAALLVDHDRVEPLPREAKQGEEGAGAGGPESRATAFLPSEMQDTLDWLFEVRAVDPACGSGAYLLMLLQRLFELVDQVEINQRRGRSDNQKHLYETKLRLLQRCVYGVDLSETAIRIARLRLWLSLVVENRGEKPDPLPNFDFLIMQGDSLASPIKPDQRVLGFPHELVDQYTKLKRDYFHPKPGVPRPTKATMHAKRAEIADWFKDELSSSKLRSFSTKPFDWEVDFAEVFDPQESDETVGGRLNLGLEAGSKGQGELAARARRAQGFDIVVANPPYVNSGALLRSVGEPYKNALVAAYPNTGTGTADLLIFFLDRAMQLLSVGGTFAFITSNKWLKAGYGKKIRSLLAKDAAVSDLVDFHDGRVFQNVICYPLITIAAKGGAARRTIYTDLPKPESDSGDPDLAAYRVRFGKPLPSDALGKDGDWRLETGDDVERLRQMTSRSVTVETYVRGRVYRGLLSGLDEVKIGDDGRYYGKSVPKAVRVVGREGVFAISGAKRAELIAADARSEEIIRPLAIGRDVHKWRVEDSDRWLIVTKIGTDMKRYPAIMRHLERFRALLSPRADQGDHWWELRSCSYYDVFDEASIAYLKFQVAPSFAIRAAGWVTNSAVFQLGGEDLYLLGILNSSPGWHEIQRVCPSIQNGRQLIWQQFKNVLIPIASKADEQKVTDGVRQILDLKAADPGADVSALEVEIDDRVKFLYFHADEAPTYDEWLAKRDAEKGTKAGVIRALIAEGESTKLEFKETLEAGGTNPQHKAAVFHSALKTICAFLNSGGGSLLIGVHDSGRIIGVEPDFRSLAGNLPPEELGVKGRDAFRQKLGNALRDRFIPHPVGLVEVDFRELDYKLVARIDITPTKGRQVLLDGKLYVRNLSATHELDVTTLDYAQNRGPDGG